MVVAGPLLILLWITWFTSPFLATESSLLARTTSGPSSSTENNTEVSDLLGREALSNVILILVPPILLASFAMQESTCNPSATGGNGEAGLMQIAQPNCGGAPGGK
jgi:hypothetical protein